MLIFAGCGSSYKFTSKKNHPPHKNTSNESLPETLELRDVSVLESETGVASYYAHAFHGNPTSNGEIYDMYGITAAHPTYPPGTIVRVTNLDNNKRVILRINDHMPEHPDRIIDISYGAAKKLDMLENGIANVLVEVIEWGD